METYKWAELIALRKLSPEKRAQLDAQIAQDLKEVTHDELAVALAMTPDEIRAEVRVTPTEFSDEEIEEIKNFVRQAMIKNKLASEPQMSQYEKSLRKRTYLVAYRSANGDFHHIPDSLRDFLIYLENHGGTVLFIISEDGSSKGRIARLCDQAKKEAERIGARF
jgi:hypothetical protein